MARQSRSSLVTRIREKLIGGFSSAYTSARVDPNKYLERLRRAHRLPIESFQDMFFVPQEIVDDLADQTKIGRAHV